MFNWKKKISNATWYPLVNSPPTWQVFYQDHTISLCFCLFPRHLKRRIVCLWKSYDSTVFALAVKYSIWTLKDEIVHKTVEKEKKKTTLDYSIQPNMAAESHPNTAGEKKKKAQARIQ